MNLVALKEERGLTSLQGRASDSAGFTAQDTGGSLQQANL